MADRGRRVRGQSLPVDDAWRLAVRAALTERGDTIQALAKRVGADRSAVYRLTRTVGEARRTVPASRYAARIAADLGVPLPIPAGVGPTARDPVPPEDALDPELRELVAAAREIRATSEAIFARALADVRQTREQIRRLLGR